MNVELDRTLCVSAAECIKSAPSAFAQDDDGISYLTDPDSASEAQLRDAEALCPAMAIHVSD